MVGKKGRKVAGNWETCGTLYEFHVGVTTVWTTHDRFDDNKQEDAPLGTVSG